MKITLTTLILVFIYTPISWAVFPAAGIDNTTSLGRFSIRLTQAMGQQWLGINTCPGNLANPNDPCRINSPGLEDPNTQIGRSDPHADNDATDLGGTLISGASIPVKDSDFSFVPGDKFQEGPGGSQEIHTQVLSFHLKRPLPGSAGPCCKNCSSDWIFTGSDATAVRAGSVAADQPRSLGEVESLGSGDFPAESFFNVFVEVDLDFDPDGPGPQQTDGIVDMTVFNKKPLVIQNDDVRALPPTVVYIHGGSDFAPLVYDKATGETIGWLTLAGHGVGYGCWTTPGPNEFDSIYNGLEEKRILERILSVKTAGKGSGTIVDNTNQIHCSGLCQGSYGHGSQVTLKAIADTGSVFSGWQQPECENEFTMNTDKQCTALFDTASSPLVFLSPLAPTMQLGVKLAGSGQGQVYSDPNGIFCRQHIEHTEDNCRNQPSDFVFHCSTPQSNNCIFDFDSASWVNLSAQAAPGSVFVGWGGHQACAESRFYMINNYYCTAYFERLQPLTVTQMGSGSGRIRSYNDGFQLTGIDCGQDNSQCYQEFPQNKQVVLVATPAAHSHFVSWQGDCQGPHNTTIIKMDKTKQCNAFFTE